MHQFNLIRTFLKKGVDKGDGTTGDIVELATGLGNDKTKFIINEFGEASILANKGTIDIRALNNNLYLSAVNIIVEGKLNARGSVLAKAPRFFTTNRLITLSGIVFSAYDLDLSLTTNKITLGSVQFRAFRITIFDAQGRFEVPSHAPFITTIFLSTTNTLSMKLYSTPYMYNDDILETYPFFYKNTIDKITFCAPTTGFFGNSYKVNFVIEDLLS